jgi:hypothetical protein
MLSYLSVLAKCVNIGGRVLVDHLREFRYEFLRSIPRLPFLSLTHAYPHIYCGCLLSNPYPLLIGCFIKCRMRLERSVMVLIDIITLEDGTRIGMYDVDGDIVFCVIEDTDTTDIVF